MRHGVLRHDVFDGVFAEGPRILGVVIVLQAGKQILASPGRPVQVLAEQRLSEFTVRRHACGFGGLGDE